MSKKIRNIILSAVLGVSLLVSGFLLTFNYKADADTVSFNYPGITYQAERGRVFLDLGHGGKDSGAKGQQKEREAYYNTLVGNEVGRILEKYGLEVVYSRRTDNETLSLTQRTDMAMKAGCEISVSLHMNANEDLTANGHDTFVFTAPSNQDVQLAQMIHNHIKSTNIFKDRGVRKENLHMTREFLGTTVLVELGFVSNNEDLDKMKDKDTRYLLCRAIARGVLDFYKIDWRNDANARFER